MIVDDEIANARLESPDNLVNKLERRELHSNRNGAGHIPPMIQTLALETGILTTQKAAAETFGMKQQTVSYYENGGGKNIDRDRVKSDVAKVHEGALEAMLESINLLKPKLVDVRKATDLSVIASNLGRVIEKTTPKEAAQTNIKVVVFAPTIKHEDDYEEMVVS